MFPAIPQSTCCQRQIEFDCPPEPTCRFKRNDSRQGGMPEDFQEDLDRETFFVMDRRRD